MPDQIARLEATITSLHSHRGVLGDAAVDAAVAALRDKITGLHKATQEQQRLQVSVMFADLVGSTVLSRHLDPEDLNAVVDGALARFTTIVQAHAGQVMQYAGDNLLAVFGVPVVREDDAERAVRAGLAITALGRELGAEVQARHGRAGFNVRVGIHSGDVLVGGGVDGSNSVRGLTPNIAARMEQTAPPGGLRISQDTYRLVRGRFELRAQPPIVVKGCEDPLATYLVLGELGAAERTAARGVEGVATRMVGRQAELAVLQQALAAMVTHTATGTADGSARPLLLQLLCVIGDAGLGKSRLLGEFQRWAQGRGVAVPHWLLASATEQRMNQPYAALRGLLTCGTGLLDSDPAGLARDKWLGAVSPALGEPAAAVLGHLLGLDFSAHEELRGLIGEPRQLRDRAFFHASQLLRAWASRGRPLVAVLDDLHWADDGTLDFIEHLGNAQADLPLLLITLTRSTLGERRASWLASITPARRIELAPLERACAAELVDELLASLTEPAPELNSLLVEHAEGNPFHIEELINLLIDQGVITTGDADALIGDTGISSAWRFHPERLQALKVPPTLVGVLRARLDALPEDERRMAQLASVVGYRFWDASVAALDAPSPSSLQGLVQRELAREHQPASLAGLREFTFKHQRLHEVAYDSVLRRVRRVLHARVAHWLLSLPGAAPLELVAEHFERGGQSALALDYWQRAAEAAANSYANAQALIHIERALQLAPADDVSRRFTLCVLRCRVLERMADHSSRAQALSALEMLVFFTANELHQTEYFILKSRYCSDGGDELAALGEAQMAIKSLTNKNSTLAADAYARIAQCLFRLGRRNDAQDISFIALEVARQINDKHIEGVILNDLGTQADDEGDYDSAINYYKDALKLHKAVGNQNNEGGTLSNIGYASMMLGDYMTAHNQLTSAAHIFSAIGHQLHHAITLINIGIVELNMQHPNRASMYAINAIEIASKINAKSTEGAAQRLIGQAELDLGNLETARNRFLIAENIFNELGLKHFARECTAHLACEALRRGAITEGVKCVDTVLQAENISACFDGMEEPIRISFICCEILAKANDRRADLLINHTYDALMQRASRINGSARRLNYLKGVPYHRDIINAWENKKRLA